MDPCVLARLFLMGGTATASAGVVREASGNNFALSRRGWHSLVSPILETSSFSTVFEQIGIRRSQPTCASAVATAVVEPTAFALERGCPWIQTVTVLCITVQLSA